MEFEISHNRSDETIEAKAGEPGRCFVVALPVQFWDLSIMPRQAGLDAPGALQEIIIRGIERKVIFKKANILTHGSKYILLC